MRYPFETLEIRQRVTEALPYEAPRILHPSHQHWVNEGVDAYKTVFGEEEWDRNTKRDFPTPMPPRGLGQSLRMRATTRAFQLGFIARGVKSGLRGTHLPGVGARGRLTVVSRPEFPEHPFFRASRGFSIRLRHANASFVDDALATVRGCAIKLADSDFESPLDLLLNTGGTAGFYSAKSFADFALARSRCKPEKHDYGPQREYARRSPAAFIGSVESIRLAPSSYADMTYYSKVVFPFHALDGVRRFVKFRLLRPDLTRESGLIPRARMERIWDHGREPDDDRPTDYLRAEFKRLLASRPPEYLLQMQLRGWDPDRDTHEVFNCNRWWPEETYPWIDLAHVQLTEPMDDGEIERTRMWLGHQPEGLGVLAADHARDYRSLASIRVPVYPFSQRGRGAYMRLRGLPKPFGDRRF